ncbi:MAG: hypothetical protein JWO05_1243 [Gemmatimonadetes bacterium]|nr:hypothetical protein [Gemmatimonadota bacterium]
MSALKICPQCGTEYELDQRFCPKDGTTLRMQEGATDLVGSIIADRYHVLRKLGEGGMGQVYLAEHVKMGRKSAVKVMNPGMVNDSDAISRFNREASNASRINHPNVCAVYDFGETPEGIIYLAMEYIEGQSLNGLIEDQGALNPLRAADIARQTGEALSVAHDMGIVHRDLKPDNIMLTKNRDGSDCVKVVDFGIAKAANSEAQKVTKTGLVVGTPEYMSPEQLAGDKLDGRSDIYALGLVAFNMLTGKLPFPAETVQESMIMRLTDKPRQLAEMKGDTTWSAEVQDVLNKALERDASLRYQTANQFGKELYKAVESMPASAMSTDGTMVMGAQSVPATRIAAAVPGAAPAAPAPVVPAPGTVAPGPVSPAGKSKMPLMAGGGIVLLAAAAGAFFFMNKGSAVKPVDSTSLPAAVSQGSPSGTQQVASNAPSGQAPAADPGRTATKLNQPLATPSGGGAPSFDVDNELDQVERMKVLDKGDEAAAGRAIPRLDLVEAQKLTNTQKVRAALLRAEAEATRNNAKKACDAVSDVEGLSKGTPFESRVANIIKLADCGK